MKTIIRLFLLSSVVLGGFLANAQSKTTTIIVVRHAEKDTSNKTMAGDPLLSKEGETRANNLVNALQDFKADALYSTNYKRTRLTLAPLASKTGLEIQSYDPRNQQALVDKIKTMQGQTIVVAGHSNTVPRLVNLLAGTDKYPDLAESVYDQIYIVRITDGEGATVEIRKY